MCKMYQSPFFFGTVDSRTFKELNHCLGISNILTYLFFQIRLFVIHANLFHHLLVSFPVCLFVCYFF